MPSKHGSGSKSRSQRPRRRHKEYARRSRVALPQLRTGKEIDRMVLQNSPTQYLNVSVVNIVLHIARYQRLAQTNDSVRVRLYAGQRIADLRRELRDREFRVAGVRR